MAVAKSGLEDLSTEENRLIDELEKVIDEALKSSYLKEPLTLDLDNLMRRARNNNHFLTLHPLNTRVLRSLIQRYTEAGWTVTHSPSKITFK